MTPILRGHASRLGLRKPPVPPKTSKLRRGQRRLVHTEVRAYQDGTRLVNLYQWRAFENGVPLEWMTTDEDLVVYSKPTHMGAMLLDQNGNGLLGQCRW